MPVARLGVTRETLEQRGPRKTEPARESEIRETYGPSCRGASPGVAEEPWPVNASIPHLEAVGAGASRVRNLMFVHSLLDDAKLSAAEFRVFAHLCRRAGPDGTARPGIRSIAATCRLDDETVGCALRGLETCGLITIFRGKGRGCQHTYQVHLTVPPNGTLGPAETVPPNGTGVPPIRSLEGSNCPAESPQLSGLAVQKEIHEGYPIKVRTQVAVRVTSAATPAGLEEWMMFCSQNYPDWPLGDIESSFNHYETVGWRYGKAPGKPVKKWEACARTCYDRWKKDSSFGRNGGLRLPSKFADAF